MTSSSRSWTRERRRIIRAAEACPPAVTSFRRAGAGVCRSMMAVRGRLGSGGPDVPEELAASCLQSWSSCAFGHLAGARGVIVAVDGYPLGCGGCGELPASGPHGPSSSRRIPARSAMPSATAVSAGEKPSRSKAITARASLSRDCSACRTAWAWAVSSAWPSPGAARSGTSTISVRQHAAARARGRACRPSATVRTHAAFPVMACHLPGSRAINSQDSVNASWAASCASARMRR